MKVLYGRKCLLRCIVFDKGKAKTVSADLRRIWDTIQSYPSDIFLSLRGM